MTTTITESEIKMIYTEIVLLAIIGVFMFFYIAQPVPELTLADEISGATASITSVSASDASWISNLISPTLDLPIGAFELLVVSSIILIPLTIMNAFVALRFIKDIATGWV